MEQMKYNAVSGQLDLVATSTTVVTSSNVLIENFQSSLTGATLQFTWLGSNNGSLGAFNPVNELNLDGTSTKTRSGRGATIINTDANSRSILYALISTYGMLMSQYNKFNTTWDIDIFGGIIDYATDPSLLAPGYTDTVNAQTITNGFYIRPPRTGESSFLKFVVVVAGTENIQDSTIPYSTAGTGRGWFQCGISWNGPTNTLVFTAKDGTSTDTFTISSFFTTYPAFINLGITNVLFAGRNGTASSPAVRAIFYDSTTEERFSNF